MPYSFSIPCITILTTDQINDWMDGNLAARGDHHLRRLAHFWQEAEKGDRIIWAAWGEEPDDTGKCPFLGHITLQEESQYPPFQRNKIFEIVDLWVHPDARQHGIGRQLLRATIDYARAHNCTALGLGVGVTHDFGAAQRLYVHEGFVPDGTGIWVQGHQPDEGDTISLQDGVIMMWVKTL